MHPAPHLIVGPRGHRDSPRRRHAAAHRRGERPLVRGGPPRGGGPAAAAGGPGSPRRVRVRVRRRRRRMRRRVRVVRVVRVVGVVGVVRFRGVRVVRVWGIRVSRVRRRRLHVPRGVLASRVRAGGFEPRRRVRRVRPRVVSRVRGAAAARVQSPTLGTLGFTLGAAAAARRGPGAQRGRRACVGFIAVLRRGGPRRDRAPRPLVDELGDGEHGGDVRGGAAVGGRSGRAARG